MTFDEFQRSFQQDYGDTWRLFYERESGTIRIKKERVALHNLQAIVSAALRISNRTGFHSMSLRDLSREAGISMGALYSYIESKERLLEMILTHVLCLVRAVLSQPPPEIVAPEERLRWLLRTHIYITHLMQPWFFFAYIEAKSFDRTSRKAAIESELLTEGLFAACIADGSAAGRFADVDPTMTAALIKPLLQDWYLKRWKYGRRGIGPDAYAERVIAFVEAFLARPVSRPEPAPSRTFRPARTKGAGREARPTGTRPEPAAARSENR